MRELGMYAIVGVSGALGFAIDRLIKWAVVSDRAPRFFVEAYNADIAFSLPFPNRILPYLIILIIAVMGYALARSFWRGQVKDAAGLFLVLLGSISNVIDRFWVGGVVDYVDLWRFPIFNMADVMIVVGVVAIIAPFAKPSSQ